MLEDALTLPESWIAIVYGDVDAKGLNLAMDLEIQICRSISLKAIDPLNENFLHFSNLVASL